MSNAYEKQTGGNHYKGFAIQPGEFCHKNKLGNWETGKLGNWETMNLMLSSILLDT